MSDRKKFLWIAGFFLVFYFLPEGNERVAAGLTESIAMMSDYAREHVLPCLIRHSSLRAISIHKPAVRNEISWCEAEKWIAYSVASVSGTVLAVCSCTVLLSLRVSTKEGGTWSCDRIFYTPACNKCPCVVLTARVLGLELGIARAIGAVIFSVVIGLLMAAIFGKKKRPGRRICSVPEEESGRPLWKTVTYMAGMVVFLFLQTGPPRKTPNSFWKMIYSMKWILAGAGLAVTVLTSLTWFNKERGNGSAQHGDMLSR